MSKIILNIICKNDTKALEEIIPKIWQYERCALQFAEVDTLFISILTFLMLPNPNYSCFHLLNNAGEGGQICWAEVTCAEHSSVHRTPPDVCEGARTSRWSKIPEKMGRMLQGIMGWGGGTCTGLWQTVIFWTFSTPFTLMIVFFFNTSSLHSFLFFSPPPSVSFLITPLFCPVSASRSGEARYHCRVLFL